MSRELQVPPQTPPTFLFHTDRDTGVPSENIVTDVLVHERQRSIGCPFGKHLQLDHAILCRQIEKERRVLRIRRPGNCGRKLGSKSKRQLGGIGWCLHVLKGLLAIRVPWTRGAG